MQHKMPFGRGARSKRGFILVATYLTVALISTFSLAYFTRANAFLQASERNQNKIVSFNMAEAATDFALAQLAADPAYAGTPAFVPLNAGSTQGGFTVTVTTPQNNPNIRLINATGFSPMNGNASRAYQATTIFSYGQLQTSSSFNFGIFAQNSIALTGNALVDSYNSDQGAYGGANRLSNGDLGTNSIANQSVTLTGNSLIKGNVTVGPTGDPETVISLSPHAVITGSQDPATATSIYPPRPPPFPRTAIYKSTETIRIT